MTNEGNLFAAMPGLPDPELDRQFYAGVPSRRFLAWCVDFAVVVAFSIVVVPLFGLLTLGFGFAIAPLVFMALSFLYRVTTISGRSATWGMRLVGIELRRGDGTRFDSSTAFLHTVLYTICVAFTPLQVGSIIAVLASRYGQTLPDFVLRTTAINTPAE